MFFKRKKTDKRELAIGLDLGTRQIKAAVMLRQASALKLADYTVVPSAVEVGKAGGTEQYAAQLQQVMTKLGTTERRARVTISCASAMVCEAAFPRVPLEEVKSALRLNASGYLRRDLSNYYLDAIELIDFSKDPKAKKSATMRVLVGGASKDEVNWYRDALVAAKIRPETIELSAVTVINALQLCEPELCKQEVLLLDIGAHSTSINFLRDGEPLMTRITHFGGDRISEFVGQLLALEPNVAEEEKLTMSDAVQPLVRQAIAPLAREVRASIDFFERQQECHISRAFACGGSACSPSILTFVSEEVGFPIEGWNPVQTLDISHFNGESAKLTSLAPSLAASIGAAVTQISEKA
jgi:type IV pilus assembly protein PilM